MIGKYTISFSVEADVEDKEELAAMIWTLLKLGKQACGETPMTVPALKEIDVESEFCGEPYQPFRLFLRPSKDAAITESSIPICYARRFHELGAAIDNYIAHGKRIVVRYVPKGTKQSEGRSVYCYSPISRVYKDYFFFKDHPELE